MFDRSTKFVLILNGKSFGFAQLSAKSSFVCCLRRNRGQIVAKALREVVLHILAIPRCNPSSAALLPFGEERVLL